MKIKHVVILAGGKGSRLRPYTVVLPKPLMPIGDYSILELIIRQLKKYKFERVTLAVGHKANLIKSFFGNGENFGINIDYVHEKKNLGTMGPLHLLNNIQDNFLVMNGDILTDMNYNIFLKFHLKNKNLFSVATYKKNYKIDFGVLKTENQILKDFFEKPKKKFEVSMGIYAVNKSILNLIPKNKYYGFDHLMKKMIKKNLKVKTFNYDGLWLDIGRQEDYFKAIDTFKNKKKNFIK